MGEGVRRRVQQRRVQRVIEGEENSRRANDETERM